MDSLRSPLTPHVRCVGLLSSVHLSTVARPEHAGLPADTRTIAAALSTPVHPHCHDVPRSLASSLYAHGPIRPCSRSSSHTSSSVGTRRLSTAVLQSAFTIRHTRSHRIGVPIPPLDAAQSTGLPDPSCRPCSHAKPRCPASPFSTPPLTRRAVDSHSFAVLATDAHGYADNGASRRAKTYPQFRASRGRGHFHKRASREGRRPLRHLQGVLRLGAIQPRLSQAHVLVVPQPRQRLSGESAIGSFRSSRLSFLPATPRHRHLPPCAQYAGGHPGRACPSFRGLALHDLLAAPAIHFVSCHGQGSAALPHRPSSLFLPPLPLRPANRVPRPAPAA